MVKLNDAEKDELHRILGKTLLEFNRFEYVAALCLYAISESDNTSIESMQDELDDHFDKTMGRLVKELKSASAWNDTFSYHLAEIVYFRNWVCHKIPRGMHIFFSEQYEFHRLLSRIRGMREGCESIRTMLEGLLKSSDGRRAKIEGLPDEFKDNYTAFDLI